MTVRRIMGIETEYGVLQHGEPYANPMLMSSQVVLAYATLSDRSRRSRWDYRHEDPLSDARGFRLDRASAHPSLLTDDPSRPVVAGPTDASPSTPGGTLPRPAAYTELARPTVESYDDPGAANVILSNGARLYVDHAHPEYSSPEVLGPRAAVIWDAAGEEVVRRAAQEASRIVGKEITLYKNNVDGKGASYGTHENFLVSRAVPFAALVDVLTPFLVTRQVFTGSGRVGLGPAGEEPGFQLSQRADYIEAEVGLETTMRRPIINTRDEPHADRDRWRRLHVIIGDANLFETATYLKLGTTSLVLWLLEHLQDLADREEFEEVRKLTERLSALMLADPVTAVQTVSRDLSLSTKLPLRQGGELTALEIQEAYLEIIRDAVRGVPSTLDEETTDVLARWSDVLSRLATDPASCARDVEWVAKWRLLDRMRERESSSWAHPRLAMLDVQWTDVRPERSIYATLVRAGAVDRITTDAEVTAAVDAPPRDTRAFLRGNVMERYADVVSAASWDAVIFDLPEATKLRRVAMPDPHRGTAADVGVLFDEARDATDFLERLSGR